MNIGVYLAGPEVFLPNAREIGARKRAICERHFTTRRSSMPKR